MKEWKIWMRKKKQKILKSEQKERNVQVWKANKRKEKVKYLNENKEIMKEKIG